MGNGGAAVFLPQVAHVLIYKELYGDFWTFDFFLKSQ